MAGDRRRSAALTATDRALWGRVVASVRPLPGRTAAEFAPPPSAEPPPAVLPGAPPLPSLPRLPTPRPLARVPHPGEATLDGHWDRRLRSGRVEPDMIVDLHGHSVEAAHLMVEGRLADAAARGARVVLVITGKGRHGPDGQRGLIRSGLSDWVALSRLRPMIAAMRPAHPRHGGGGAFYVVLRRERGA